MYLKFTSHNALYLYILIRLLTLNCVFFCLLHWNITRFFFSGNVYCIFNDNSTDLVEPLLLNILLDCSCSYSILISARPGKNTNTAPGARNKNENDHMITWFTSRGRNITEQLILTCRVVVFPTDNPLQEVFHQIHVNLIQVHCWHGLQHRFLGV